MSDLSQYQKDRQAEVDALIARANDLNDPYDGHHGNDTSPKEGAQSSGTH